MVSHWSHGVMLAIGQPGQTETGGKNKWAKPRPTVCYETRSMDLWHIRPEINHWIGGRGWVSEVPLSLHIAYGINVFANPPTS